MSDDGAWSIVVIALLGNPFSPSVLRAGGKCAARALDHCALNVALYGPRGSIWALRERAIADDDCQATGVTLGRSRVAWEGDALVVDVDERTSPMLRPGRPVRGRVIVRPDSVSDVSVPLDEGGRHAWSPVAPCGRIEVALDEPGVRFEGDGYHDANAGDVPLGASFSRWSWSRARVDRARAAITYDVVERSGATRSFAYDVDARGRTWSPLEGLRAAPLPTTAWNLTREARVDGPGVPWVFRELEDTPFYARALVDTCALGRRVLSVHETLCLDRLEQRWVQFLLGFRMGRA